MCNSLIRFPGQVPFRCGQCMECRLAYSREWAIRISNEARCHEKSSFITLTYDQQNLPRHGQLVKSDLQKFFKRLRKAGYRFRYVAAGEYGDTSRRPHFHTCLFGVDFAHDRVELGCGAGGSTIYCSATLARIWGKGSITQQVIGSLTFESAAYVARYITKRVSGIGASPLPLAIDPDTGDCVMPNPEFLLCSKGIGKSWFHTYFMSDVFPHARCITDQGTPAPVPRYYKKLLKDIGHDLSLDMQFRTSQNMEANSVKFHNENLPERRAARSQYAQSRNSIFKRNLRAKNDVI